MDALSTRNVFTIVPGAGPATLNVRNRNNGFDAYPLLSAKQKPVTRDILKLRPELLNVTSCIWQLWQADLDQASAPDPRARDKVTGPDGTDWVITLVLNKLLGNVFNCVCTKAVSGG